MLARLPGQSLETVAGSGAGFALIHGRPRISEAQYGESVRVSPHDTEAGVWVAYRARAKLDLGAYEEALDFYRPAKELFQQYCPGALIPWRRVDGPPLPTVLGVSATLVALCPTCLRRHGTTARNARRP